MEFDWVTYINSYPDLKINGINDKHSALNHYEKYGKYENRICPEFNWKLYLNLNPDLDTAGINTKEKAEQHWFTYGYKESRLKTINYYSISNINLYEKKLLNNLLKSFIINNKIITIHRSIYPINYNNDTKKKFIMSFDNKKLVNNKIPKKIHKIFLNDTKNYIDKNIYINAISTWETYYPDHIITIYDKNDAINYLNKYYGKEFVYIYNLLIPFAYKCDFLRLCILYEEGGIYSDIKQSINTKIDFEKYNFVYSEEKHFDWRNYIKIDYSTIQNCFIATVPKHPYIKCAIDLIIQNVLNRYYCLCDIDITGPVVFGCSINHVKKHWSFCDETLEKKIYFNKYKTNNLTTYVLSEYNMEEIKYPCNYLIKHKYDDDCGINNWCNELQKNNSQIYSVSWKYNEVFVPTYSYNNDNNDNNDIDRGVSGYELYLENHSYTYMNSEKLLSINSFILIIDSTNEDNIYMNNFINNYNYCKTFITVKIINEKFLIICNNNIQILNIDNICDVYVFLSKFLNKISNIILWDDIPSNNTLSISIQKIIKYIDERKHSYTFKLYKSFYLYSKNEQEDIISIDKYIKHNDEKTIFMNDIKPFMIYFPQFHYFKENDLNFYEGFTDAVNLQKLVDSNTIFPQNHKIITPLICDNIKDYNLTNIKIIEKQIDILEKYEISGLAIYYYWFSKNTITHKNMIMKDVIDIFFNINLKNRKIYFIWANECWSKSYALSQQNNNNLIENTYDTINLQKNINNLINYFKNDGYLKINNKPVLFIHHPWLITEEELKNMYTIFNETCILNNFDGIEIVVNSMFKKISEFKNYNHNLNYKWHSDKNYECKYYYKKYSKNVVDYNKYINSELGHIKKDEINVYFTDFDNSARLIEPNKLHMSTTLVNNTDLNKQLFLHDIVRSYKNKINYIDKILLINGFNEWGEQMAFEPSKEYEYYNLNLLANYLKKNDNDNIVIIMTGGKTAGETLTKTLNEFCTSYHFHDDFHFRFTNNQYDSVYEFIDKNKIKYIITVSRNIFERKISGLFQCLTEPNSYNQIFNIPSLLDENPNLDELYNFFEKKILYSDFESYEPVDKLLSAFNKKMPTNFFNFKKKYGVIELNDTTKIIVLRFKDINIWEEILSNIFNKKIKLMSTNITNNKINVANLFYEFKLKVKNTNLFSEFSVKETPPDLFNGCHDIDDLIEIEKSWTNN
jgi:hypothetical protein